jgi:NAD+ kinase
VSTPEKTRTIRVASVITHRRADETVDGIAALQKAAERAGVELVLEPELEQKGRARGDVTIVLGGDGATLRALRANAGTGVPVFAINFGRIGFLATADRDELDVAIERALEGRFDVLPLPAIVLDGGGPGLFGINEVSFQRRSHLNMAQISYSIAGDDIGERVPCDGLIAATPAGSTGYNLSVGGPILAWGVKAYTVSLIAPHALSARALVAAPEDVLRVVNDGREPVDIVVDGMRTGELDGGKAVELAFKADVVGLAQLPGSSFYRRFREKLIQLTS